MTDKLWLRSLCLYCIALLLSLQLRTISCIGDAAAEQPSPRSLQDTPINEVVEDSDSSGRFHVPYHDGSPQNTTFITRRLSQSNGPSQAENQFPCTFSRADAARMYDGRTRTWTVDDAVIEELEDDIQSIVNCTGVGDIISIRASKTVTPRSTLIIPWNLTITGSNRTRTNGNEEGTRVRGRVEITCPRDRTLLVSRSNSFTISGFVISGCRGNSSVIVLDSPCEDDMEAGLVRFLNTYLTSHNLFGGGRILEAENASCSEISMQNVRLAGNRCSKGVCVLVHGTQMHLRNIEVRRNRDNDRNSSGHGVFSLEDSEASVSDMDSRGNRIRTFHVVRSTLRVSNSEFSRNNISSSSTDEEVTSGGVLYAVQSNISLNASEFQNNSAVSGGVIFTNGTQLNISDCVFDGNESPSGNGGAIFTQNGTGITLVSSLFTNNHAEFGAGVYSSRMADVRVVDSNFTGNACEEDGGGLFVFDGNVSIRHCDFTSNIALDDGAAVQTDRVNLTLLHTTFQYNNGSYGGACFFRRTFSRSIRSVQFIGNRATTDGGGFYVTLDSDIHITDSRFADNEALSNGGVFVGRHQSRVVLQGVQFHNNTANNHGGVCYIFAVTLIARYVQVLSNRAQGDGGAFTLLREVVLFSSK